MGGKIHQEGDELLLSGVRVGLEFLKQLSHHFFFFDLIVKIGDYVEVPKVDALNQAY